MLALGLVIAATVGYYAYNVAIRPTQDVVRVASYLNLNTNIRQVIQQVSKLAVGVYTNDSQKDPELDAIIKVVNKNTVAPEQAPEVESSETLGRKLR